MKFDQNIIGNTLPQKILYNAIASHKPGHAYLFTGEEEIGKRTLAFAIAKTLLCREAIPFCGRCSSCLKAEQKTHPDLFEIAPDGAMIKIGQIKQLQDQMMLQPAAGFKKVFIIDAADQMNQEAANAFLKSLEEPPVHTHFFLLSSRPQMLLPTLVSRCQHIRFFPPSQEEVAAFLCAHKNMPMETARRIARRTHGKVGMALSLNLQSLNEEDDIFFKMMEPSSLVSSARIFQFSEEHARDPEHLKKSLEWISSWIRDMILWKNSQKGDLLIFEDRMNNIKDRADYFSMEVLYQTFAFIQKSVQNLTRNLNRSLVLESILLKLRKEADL